MSKLGYEGKRVVVTGAASGMGHATASHLVEDGAEVIALDLNQTDVKVASSHQVDLRSKTAVDDFVATVDGRVDALFNCAGAGNPGPEPIDTVRLNFLGTRQLAEGLLPKMERGGAVGNIASKSGINWFDHMDVLMKAVELTDWDECEAFFAERPETHNYGVAKGAVIVYTYYRSAQLAPQGIRMNSISPGAVDTNFFGGSKPSLEQMGAALGPIGRYAEPREMAEPLIFLNSDAASYISGMNLIVDAGGWGGFVTRRLEPPPLPTYQSMLAHWADK
jgi:NAD(P)-dependent dehydrogenase (short-subunit alcohol dehydrogenase family)